MDCYQSGIFFLFIAGGNKSAANKGVVDKVRKESCPFCKEQKKRPLIAYIRKRENRQQKESICEADEHEE